MIEGLKDLSPEDADFMITYRGEIASILGDFSLWAGVGTAVAQKNLSDITKILIAIETLYQDTYRTHGNLKSPEFFERRKRLIAELDGKFMRSTRIRGFTSLGDHPTLKKALGISSRSLVHNWRKSGGPGPIPGYSNYIRPFAKAVEHMKIGGNIAIGIGGVSSILAIQEVCATGSEEACKKIMITEPIKFFGSTGGAWAGTKLSIAANPVICLGRSASVVSTAVCSIVVVSAGTVVGGAIGSAGGEAIGEVIYHHFLYD